MDLIKREDAIKAVSEPFDRKYWQYTTRSIRDTVKALKDIPSAEPTIEIDADQLAKLLREGWTIHSERNQGEWVPFEYGDERWHKCTACGVADRYIEYVERPNGTTGKLVAIRNYCPNCGARMKGADNDSNII